jgi:predicted nucleic-acid-binding Zn-ribbon protein
MVAVSKRDTTTKPEGACPRCGGTDLIPSAAVFDQGRFSDGLLKVGLDKYPKAGFFSERGVQALKASICGRCGHAELYVADPKALYQDYVAATTGRTGAAAEQPELLVREGPPDACLACGVQIPQDQTKCPSCGWTYSEEPA